MIKVDGEMSKVTLATIGKGAASELFDVELQRALENIDDPNRPAKEKREINIKITLLPNEQRDFCSTEISVSSKLPPIKGAATATAWILQRDGKKHVALEPKGKQGSLFDAPNIRPIGGDK